MSSAHDRPFDASLLSGSYSVTEMDHDVHFWGPDGRDHRSTGNLAITIRPMSLIGYVVIVVHGDAVLGRWFLFANRAVAWANDQWEARIAVARAVQAADDIVVEIERRMGRSPTSYNAAQAVPLHGPDVCGVCDVDDSPQYWAVNNGPILCDDCFHAYGETWVDDRGNVAPVRFPGVEE